MQFISKVPGLARGGLRVVYIRRRGFCNKFVEKTSLKRKETAIAYHISTAILLGRSPSSGQHAGAINTTNSL